MSWPHLTILNLFFPQLLRQDLSCACCSTRRPLGGDIMVTFVFSYSRILSFHILSFLPYLYKLCLIQGDELKAFLLRPP